MRTALVIGATGLVGTALVDQLLHDDRFSETRIFVRRPTGRQHPRLREHVVDFEAPESWSHQLNGDVLFSAMGTTLRQAGSKEAQYRIDHTYQYRTAKAAADNGVPVYVLVSAAMSDPRSRVFYSRMKGELERDVQLLSFSSIQILQPGLLDGSRTQRRRGEALALGLVGFLNRLGILRKQRPIPGTTVARAMIQASFRARAGVERHALLELFRLAGEVA